MARMIGVMANDGDRLAALLRQLGETLSLPTSGRDAWGMGFYTSGQALVRKRPAVDPAARTFADLVGATAATALVAQVQDACGEGIAERIMRPLRHQQWVFAYDGVCHSLAPARPAMVRDLPEHWRRRIERDADAEALFAFLLGRLQAVGLVEADGLFRERVADCVTAALRDVERWHRDEGGSTQWPAMSFVLGNGQLLLAGARGRKMRFRLVEGLAPPEPLDVLGAEAFLVRQSYKRLRAVVVVSEAQAAAETPGWNDLADGALLYVARRLEMGTRSWSST